MKILVLGNGAREHALAWKIKRSPACKEIYLHPGNAGTRRLGFEPLPLECQSAEEISRTAKQKGIELVVIGPEVLLAHGYADVLRREGFLVVGPDKFAAQLESSKVFAKEFMKRAGVPTAAFKVATSFEDLSQKLPQTFPTVLKLDGLAAGKGVVIPHSRSEALDFAQRVYKSSEFGPGPHQVLIEDYLPGKEVSYIGFCDGERFIPCASATDYKRVYDGNEGPNTGGMGALSPSPYFSPALETKIQNKIIEPILKGLKTDEISYRGILFIGLMVDAQGDPYVLEFNARFGDPETQAILLRMESDLVPFLMATANGHLRNAPPLHWNNQTSVYVVASADGYPTKPRLGDVIGGLENLAPHAAIFFSGVSEKENFLVTSGGRVLGVGCLGQTVEGARTDAYAALKQLHWRGMHFRNDIGLTHE